MCKCELVFCNKEALVQDSFCNFHMHELLSSAEWKTVLATQDRSGIAVWAEKMERAHVNGTTEDSSRNIP